jgi:hypothetical protein
MRQSVAKDVARNSGLQMPPTIYTRDGPSVVFNQLAVKIEMDAVSNERYFRWLDDMRAQIAETVPGSQIAEKEHARISPPLNTAIYYDTEDYRLLPTGALLRTSCNRITHAFCAFKAPQDRNGVRNDHRYVFAGEEKATIQNAPASPEAVAIVKSLLSRTDIEHPGTFLGRHLGIPPERLEPAIHLEDYRFTFFAWLDGKDALRCSLDRFQVSDLRSRSGGKKSVSEVEVAIYPRIAPDVAQDPRVVRLITTLAESLCRAQERSSTSVLRVLWMCFSKALIAAYIVGECLLG